MESTDLVRASFPEHPRQQLLLTKLRAPRPASDGIVRERLMREIDRGVEGKLTLMVAPAGYGKSTLVSHWQTRADRPQRSTNLVLHHNVGEHHRKAMLAQLDGRRRRFLRVDPYGPSKGEQIVQRSGQQQPVAAQPHRR